MFAIAATMFWLDPFLALTALSTVPVAAMATMIYRRLSTPSYAQARAKSTSTLQEKVSGLRVVQSHNQQELEGVPLRALSAQLRIPLYSIEDWQQLSRIVNAWQQATASGKHIDELLATEGTEDLGSSSLLPVTGALHLDEVTFSYPASHEPALNKLTLTIPEGMVVAVVGRSGAGKSTLIKLIAGLYFPTHGNIRIGVQMLDDASLTEYRRQIGLVDQDVALFSSDIAENIRYSRHPPPMKTLKLPHSGQGCMRWCAICRRDSGHR